VSKENNQNLSETPVFWLGFEAETPEYEQVCYALIATFIPCSMKTSKEVQNLSDRREANISLHTPTHKHVFLIYNLRK
jgi:hypothetical protein